MPKLKYTDRARRPSYDADPFDAVLRPPEGETPFERDERLEREHQAQKKSDKIDEMLKQEKKERRLKQEVKVLLLGQSESGKSTTLKQFQLLHSSTTFNAERIAWRAVIYLNLVRSVNRIMEAIAPEPDQLLDDQDELDNASMLESGSIIHVTASGRPASAISGTRVPNYDSYRARLTPLIALEQRLVRLLSCPEEDEAIMLGPIPSGWKPVDMAPPTHLIIPSNTLGANLNVYSAYKSSSPVSPASSTTSSTAYSSANTNASSSIASGSGSLGSRVIGQEMALHHTTNWKQFLGLTGKAKSPRTEHGGEIVGWWNEPDDPVHTLTACRPAMIELWRDPKVQLRLKEKRIRLEETSGFYLNDIPRITAMRYIPKDDDILRARIKTMGVVEHTFILQDGSYRGVTWKIYDVGGARNQRQAWAPYFSDVNAIIFLAPISAFDQHLVEDPRVNRLEDTIMLWQTLVSNPLLPHVNIVLFLNKIDLLKAKLVAGVRVSHHMTSYETRPNDYETVSKYFYNKFGAIHQHLTPNKSRELFIHFTCVTDTRNTHTIMTNVRDIIIKGNLRTLSLV